jgi:triosephosphate isomerase
MYIVANWKMNGTRDDITVWADALAPSAHNVILCPPLPLVDEAVRCAGLKLYIGAQDCAEHDAGPYTGFTSPVLLKEMGCAYVILGHSERRHLESNGDVRQKAHAAQKAGLIPIICVGEDAEIREREEHLDFVKRQAQECTSGLSRDLSAGLSAEFFLAYEPKWAIGTGRVCDVSDIEEMHGMLRALYREPLLYGGSVTPQNAKGILDLDNVDGVLVGGASLDVHSMNGICA